MTKQKRSDYNEREWLEFCERHGLETSQRHAQAALDYAAQNQKVAP